MALMIPSVISPEVKSSAERRIFEWFKSAPGTEDWIVLHSLGIATHNRVIYSEVDFFVMAPKLGIFALEVKGGRVRRQDGVWYFTDRYDKIDSKIRGPFDQAKEGVFSIVSAMKGRLDGINQHLSDVLFGYGVMFPDIEYTASGVDEEQWQVFDANDGINVKRYIERLAVGARDKWETAYGKLDLSRLPEKADVCCLASILRGDFDCAVAISAQLRNADDALVTLTKEQYRCLDQLDDNPRCLIQGPAGTGKTLIAIEEVKKSAARGEKAALFCFNSNLADWLAGYFSEMPEELRPAFVGTFHRFMTQVCRQVGKTPVYPSDRDDVQHYYQEILPGAALDALVDIGCLFEKIIVDEAQDLISNNYLKIMDACLRRGLTRGRWFMFGDFSMQAIFSDGLSESDPKGKLEDITSFVRFKLHINCRNTKPICEEIQTVTGFSAPSDLWTRIDGPPVQYITWASMEEQHNKLNGLLRQLSDAHIHPEQITILSPRKREYSVVSMIEGYDIREFRIPETLNMTFCTIQAFKGLENTVIILTDIENYSANKLMYVGLSRARSGLYIFESEAAAKEYDDLLVRRLCK